MLKSGTPEYEAYVDQGWARHLEHQAMHLAGIKGRYHHLNIQWNPVIEKEAMKRDGGGITVYLRRIAADQEQTREEQNRIARASNPQYGTW